MVNQIQISILPEQVHDHEFMKEKFVKNRRYHLRFLLQMEKASIDAEIIQ